MIDGYFRVKYSTGAIVCDCFQLLDLSMTQARKIFKLALKCCDSSELLLNVDNLLEAVMEHQKKYRDGKKTKSDQNRLKKAERLYSEFYSAASALIS